MATAALSQARRLKDDVFPGPHEELVVIAAPECEAVDTSCIKAKELIFYDGFTTMLESKTLFVRFPRTTGWHQKDFVQSMIALIELGETVLHCGRIVVCLQREPAELHSLVHSLMYVGFTPTDEFAPSPGFVLLDYAI